MKPIMETKSELIAIRNLLHHPHEQESRLTPTAIAGLKEDIQSSGYIAPLVVMRAPRQSRDTNIDTKYVVIDGNRRLRCAIELGRSDLKCDVLQGSGDIDVLFVWLNAHPRHMPGSEKLKFLASAPEKWDLLALAMPASFQKRLKEFEAAVGRSYAIKVGLEGKYGPEVMQYVRKLQSGLGHRAVEIETGELVKWMLAHKMQGVALRLTRPPYVMTGRDARRIERCVEENVAFTNRKPKRARAVQRTLKIVG